MLRILTDRGTEYCGKVEQHDYQLYLAINNIDHTKTKARSPQTNGICERFHRTILQEFYQVAFRKKLYGLGGFEPPSEITTYHFKGIKNNDLSIKSFGCLFVVLVRIMRF